eukprot:15239210-Ditylum_brightwellii.AAC.1
MGIVLWFVTDGGVTGLSWYFGWVLAMSTKILWDGKGQSEGNPELMESLQSESTSLLALEFNIFTIVTTAPSTREWHTTLAGEKKKQQITQCQTWTSRYRSKKHVKGHQDKLSKSSNTKNDEDKDKKKDQKLTWQA